jgi:1-acyl-sn-glycerol-3-phosphate acyltransferase
MSNKEPRARCKSLTRSGNPCHNYALAGSEYCRVHQAKTEEAEPELSQQELRRQLVAELEKLIEQLQAITPDYTPPAYSSQRLLAFFDENLKQICPDLRLRIMERLHSVIDTDLFDPDTWKGLWFLLDYTVKSQADILRRRFTGEYETDEWGLDWELLETVIPFVNFMYNAYWRVETTGIDNIPLDGRALLVSNHSGQLPWDGVMVGAAVWNEHPSQRLVRSLYDAWIPTVPVLSAMLVKMGQVVETVENGTRLLEQDELVAVYPEGYQGLSKPFKDRYQLTSFGRGGFVKMALDARAPIIPVAVVGAEETYVSLGNSPTLARLTGLPYFPISLTFPWLGLLGLVPLPTKWTIDFGEPIPMDANDPGTAPDLMLISQLTNQVRDVVQEMINERLAQRRSVFAG